MTTPPNFDTTHQHNAGSIPKLDKLQTDTALLRRIAYNTDGARIYLGWLLAITILGFIAAVIVGIVLIAHTPTPAPAATPNVTCQLAPSTC